MTLIDARFGVGIAAGSIVDEQRQRLVLVELGRRGGGREQKSGRDEERAHQHGNFLRVRSHPALILRSARNEWDEKLNCRRRARLEGWGRPHASRRIAARRLWRHPGCDAAMLLSMRPVKVSAHG